MGDELKRILENIQALPDTRCTTEEFGEALNLTFYSPNTAFEA